MAERPWKAEECRAARLFGGGRFPANPGGGLDFETDAYLGQVRHRRRLSLPELEALGGSEPDAEHHAIMRDTR